MANVSDYIKRAYIVDDYHSIEKDFIKFIEYFPLSRYPEEDDMKKITSPKLADLLLRIGSKIDISFSSRINNPNRELNWNDYKNLEPELKLSDYSVFSTHNQEYMTPFEDWQYIKKDKLKKPGAVAEQVDFWWTAYNNVKHHYNIENANLYHVYNSLSALFILVCVFKTGRDYSRKLVQYNYLNIDSDCKKDILKSKMDEYKNSIITKLFMKELENIY